MYLTNKLTRKSTMGDGTTTAKPVPSSSLPPTLTSTSGTSLPPAIASDMPAQFVAAMRTLFDIMDDRGTGHVRLSDIERRWPTDGTAPGLPHGVIDSLRRVAPASGQLSFERFCSGLKMSLMQRNQKPTGELASMTKTPLSVESKQRTTTAKHPQQPTNKVATLRIATATAAVRPNSRHSSTIAGRFPGVHRALSLPKLCASSGEPSASEAPLSPTIAPPKPPRTALVLGNGVTNINHLDQLDKAEIRYALQTWQMGVLMNEKDAKARGTADGGSTTDSAGGSPLGQANIKSATAMATSGRGHRREPRRHTLQNGIDYNLLKQLKQLEQEKEVLQHGLDAVMATRAWYDRQLMEVQERIRMLGKANAFVVGIARCYLMRFCYIGLEQFREISDKTIRGIVSMLQITLIVSHRLIGGIRLYVLLCLM